MRAAKSQAKERKYLWSVIDYTEVLVCCPNNLCSKDHLDFDYKKHCEVIKHFLLRLPSDS